VSAKSLAAILHRLAHGRAYSKAHPRTAYKAAWYLANRARLAAKERERYLADPERAKAKVREWERANPIRTAAHHAAKAANSRARDYRADGQLSPENVLDLWRREPHCIDCGEGRGLDHIMPLSRGGSNTTGNLANRCRSCNSRKGARERRAAAA
jgi:5-methylcytosine-specific restriction endonuclease McrA